MGVCGVEVVVVGVGFGWWGGVAYGGGDRGCRVGVV